MNIIYKGFKSNYKDLTMTETVTTDIISYIFVVETDAGCESIIIKSELMENEYFPKIREDHPILPGLQCTNIVISQISNDASTNLAIAVEATYTAANESGLTSSNVDNLFDYNRGISKYEVPFIRAYASNDPIPEQYITKNKPDDVIKWYSTISLSNSWKRVVSEVASNSTPSIPVNNTVGGKLNAKTVEFKSVFSFSYYAEVFNITFIDTYLNSTNVDDISFEDVTIPAFCGLISKLDYSYVILSVRNEEYDVIEKKAYYKIDIEIEYYPKGVGQRLANLSTMYNENARKTSTTKRLGLQRIYTDSIGRYGTVVCPNDVENVLPAEIDYNKRSTFGAKEVIQTNIGTDLDKGAITDDEYNKLVSQIAPIDEPLPISIEGRICTYYNDTLKAEEYVMVYRDFLDARPSNWEPLGFSGRITSEYEEFMDLRLGGQ